MLHTSHSTARPQVWVCDRESEAPAVLKAVFGSESADVLKIQNEFDVQRQNNAPDVIVVNLDQKSPILSALNDRFQHVPRIDVAVPTSESQIITGRLELNGMFDYKDLIRRVDQALGQPAADTAA